MNDELQQKLNESGAELIDWLKSAAENGGEFVAEQAPLLAAEIVAWHFWSSICLAGLFVCLGAVLAMGAYASYRFWKSAPSGYEGCDQTALSATVGLLCAAFAAASIIGGGGLHAYEAVKAAVAPRIVLIEYAGKALGGSP